MANSPPGNAPAAAEAIDHAEFASLLARLGPWDTPARVAVAVSGGADSLCLALLTHAWGNATAIIVDHGLRPESGQEAAWTAAVLAARFVPVRIVKLTGLRPGPGLAARAREARYAALTQACVELGLVDLFLGHHAGDQAETILMRERRSSGPAGLAGMAALAPGHSIRLVRPLLGMRPERLRATLRRLGQQWLEDPSNADPRFTRSRLRAELAQHPAADPPLATAGRARALAEALAADELAACAMIHPAGFAIVAAQTLSAAALAALLRAIGGGHYPPPSRAVARLAGSLGPSTLAGVRLLPAGRLGAGWLLVREAAAVSAPIDLTDGAVWDGRFRVQGQPDGSFTLGALGSDARLFRRLSPWQAVILQSLPAIRRNNGLCAVPHLAYGCPVEALRRVGLHHAASPVCPSPFEQV